MIHSPSFPVCAIGIDAGGTKIAAGLLTVPNGRVLARRIVPTNASRSGQAVLDDVVRLARELAGESAAQGHPVAAIGLGVCELVDLDGNLASANCLQWLDLPVRQELSAIAPAVIEADVRAAALAESLFGEGKAFHTFLYATIGTGISCCLMIDGRPLSGSRGFAGTMASSPLSVACDQCGHISRRTLEEIAAGPSLAASLGAASGNEVLAAASAGHARAIQIIQTAAEALGAQLGLLVNVLDPEAVIIGGGLGLSEGMYRDAFIAATRRHIYAPAQRDLPILSATTGPDAGWIGAAAAAVATQVMRT